ncbi:unnamed protein product [Owenia fusiformis]|uniref:Uncharacterized protein n=1 Tax=Owenia fusiformis TaxID=6347 RepID=A0A8J1TRT8_OWEFU|nr:unnamed protein product [Owenia fusiformis]
MASKSDPNEASYLNILKCPICFEVLANPKVTPCMHTICCGCLDNWIQEQGQSKCPCPICNVEFDPPIDGAKSLKGNYILNDMLDQIHRQEEDEITGRLCDICMLDDERVCATSKCIDCNQYTCRVCSRAHKNIKAVQDHSIIPIGKTGDKAIESITHMFNKMQICSSHPDEELNFYCRSCNDIVCSDCCRGTHSGHKYRKLSKVIKQDIQDISSLIEISLQREEEINDALQDMTKFKEKLEEDASDAIERITTNRKVQHSLIDKHYNEQIYKLRRIKFRASNNADAHIDDLQMENGKTMSTRLHLMNQQQCGHPVEIINMREEVRDTTEEWSKPQEFEFDSRVELEYIDGRVTPSGLEFGQVASQ